MTAAPLTMALLFCVPLAAPGAFDPAGKTHIPIGIPNTVDTLKTFVEPEGCFSPGVGSYGVYFWARTAGGQPVAPPPADATVERGLDLAQPGSGYPLPWSRWRAHDVEVTVDVCHVERDSPQGRVHCVAARATLRNLSPRPIDVSLLAALRPTGPAGGPVCRIDVAPGDDALLVDGRAAIVADRKAARAAVVDGEIGSVVSADEWATGAKTASSRDGAASGALGFDLHLAPNAAATVGIVCPVLPGRRAVGHQWDGTSGWAQFDLAELNPKEGGQLQPDPGLDYYRGLKVDDLFAEARRYWQDFFGPVMIDVPDRRWGESLRAIAAHAALAMNQGAPDVAVVNYNVFNRDGVYVANILQKSGRFDLAAAAIDYFLAHPFNGRVRVEADNPGQVLWIMGEHWRFARDRAWLSRVLPSAGKLAAMIEYYRTAPGPHYVKATSLDFGDCLPPDRLDESPAQRKQVLKPGSCDGHHPEYTEAFDIAGLRAAAELYEAARMPDEAARIGRLADALFARYDAQFGANLGKGYGSYSVLWPCRLYPFSAGKGFEQFQGIGQRKPGGWRYFPLATAHQGLLAGNREAGHGTLGLHLDHPQMRGWYAFDEGGRSGSGGWRRLKTTWNGDVAMPHGWAIAEFWLLVRDSLVFEDGQRLVLLAGVPSEWLSGERPIRIENLPTAFGRLSLDYGRQGRAGRLTLSGSAVSPEGFVLRLAPLKAIKATPGVLTPAGDVLIGPQTKECVIELAE